MSNGPVDSPLTYRVDLKSVLIPEITNVWAYFEKPGWFSGVCTTTLIIT